MEEKKKMSSCLLLSPVGGGCRRRGESFTLDRKRETRDPVRKRPSSWSVAVSRHQRAVPDWGRGVGRGLLFYFSGWWANLPARHQVGAADTCTRSARTGEKKNKTEFRAIKQLAVAINRGSAYNVKLITSGR